MIGTRESVRSSFVSGRELFDGFRYGSWLRILKSQRSDERGNRQINVQSITVGDKLEI
jgi:hypothetical protein